MLEHEVRELNPYFALVKGEDVRLSNILKYAEYALPMVDCLMRLNKCVGQRYLFEDGDMLLKYISQPVDSGKTLSALKSHEIPNLVA